MALVFSACDLTGDPAPANYSSDAADAAPSPEATVLRAPGTGCGRDVETGVRNLGVEVLGATRTARLYVPTSYNPNALSPLVINFQGGGLHAPQYNGYTSFTAAAEANSFVAVLPDVDQDIQSWRVDVGARIDVEFVERLLGGLKEQLCIDEARVYAMGYSDGAAFAHVLACSGTQLAGLAVVSAPRTAPCPAARPLSVIGFHGSDDPLQPYAAVMPDDWALGWAIVSACRLPPLIQEPNPEYSVSIYTSCSLGAPVVFYNVRFGGHTWPGAAPNDALGLTTLALDATAEIVRFFELDLSPAQ